MPFILEFIPGKRLIKSFLKVNNVNDNEELLTRSTIIVAI